LTENGIFSATSGTYRDINFLEDMFIGYALRRNPEIENKKQTKLLREMVIPLLLNTEPGRPTDSTYQFADVLGFN